MKSWLEIALDALEQRGLTEIFTLVSAARKAKPVSATPSQLAWRLFRLTEDSGSGVTILEHPRFGLKTLKRPDRLHLYYIQNLTYKVLALRPNEYLDIEAINTKAKEVGLFKGNSVKSLHELAAYQALTDRRFASLFAKKGALKLTLGKRLESRSISSSPSAKNSNVVRGKIRDAHEAHIESVLAENLGVIESGLMLVGRQYLAPPVGRIDLLCKDRYGQFVVIELKKFGASAHSIIDQVTRYMGWIKANLASKRNQVVRGIIIVGQPDEKLTYSARAIPNLETKCFSLSIDNF